MKILTNKKIKKKLIEECWNLDFELIKWLNEHLKVYIQESIKAVDLEFHKFKYKNKEYTQLEIINRLIEITDMLLRDEPYNWGNYDRLITTKEIKTINARKNEMYDLLKLVHWQLWW